MVHIRHWPTLILPPSPSLPPPSLPWPPSLLLLPPSASLPWPPSLSPPPPSGYPPIEGATILEKRRYVKAHLDHLRTLLMSEPRGHSDMYGALLVESDLPEADMAALFMHNEGTAQCSYNFGPRPNQPQHGSLLVSRAGKEGARYTGSDTHAG